MPFYDGRLIHLPPQLKKGLTSFEYNDNIYGVQCHPEFSWEVTRILMALRIARGISVDNNL